jgi:hypothetical protein
MGKAADDDDFSEEIQDIGTKQGDSIEATGGVFSVRHGEESEWFGLRRHSGGLMEHHRCCFGINHWRWSEGHQLFMLDVLAEGQAKMKRVTDLRKREKLQIERKFGIRDLPRANET